MATPAILKPHFVWSSPLSKSENTTHTNTALASPCVLPCPRRVAGYLSAVRIDEQEDVAPTLPAHRRKVRTKASLDLSGYALNFALVWPLLRPHSLMAAARCLLLEQILHLASAPLCSGSRDTRYFFPRRRRREVPVFLRSGFAAQACSRSTSEWRAAYIELISR